jgi:hypothetical protein
MKVAKKFRFQPISFSWVALHPEPKGVVVFIGGAFFGTFPTLFYRYFLRQIFEAGYTVVTLPFRFSFRHWSIALDLLQEERKIREYLLTLDASTQSGNSPQSCYKEDTKYLWIGHSLGCKYLCLLELLTDITLNPDQAESLWQKCIQLPKSGYQQALQKLMAINASIQGQSTILIAPDISDTESAVPKPLTFIAHWLDRRGWGVLPTRQETQCLINASSLFNLTALISFDRDTIAGNLADKDGDVYWFFKQLGKRSHSPLVQELPGKHLEPIGIQVGEYLVDFNPLDKFIKPLAKYQLPSIALQFIAALQGNRTSDEK